MCKRTITKDSMTFGITGIIVNKIATACKNINITFNSALGHFWSIQKEMAAFLGLKNPKATLFSLFLQEYNRDMNVCFFNWHLCKYIYWYVWTHLQWCFWNHRGFRVFQHHTPSSRRPSLRWSNPSLCPDGKLATLPPWLSSLEPQPPWGSLCRIGGAADGSSPPLSLYAQQAECSE